MLKLIWLVLLLVFSTAVVWKGSNILESSSEKLAVYYELPAIVQGAIIAAIGSSFPELSSTVISSLIHGNFELGVGIIVGSAIFNILVIPALSGLFSKDGFEANRDLVYKEAQFYMLATATLVLTFTFAVIYNPVTGKTFLAGELNRKLVLIPLGLYLLYIFIQHLDTIEYRPEASKPEINSVKQWGLLGFSLVLIIFSVEGLVRSAIGLGNYFNTPSFLWGITVIAAGTSIADAFVSIKSARKGRAITSLANVLGSNTFDLLVAIPVGVLIAGTAVINFSRAAPLLGALVFATLVLFVFTRTDLELENWESFLLLFIYFIFVLWMALETIGVTSLVL